MTDEPGSIISSGTKSRFKKIIKLFISFLILLLLCACIFLNTYKVDYVIFEPGDAISVHDSISISSDEIDKTKGDIKFLTVYVSSERPSLFEYWKAKYWDDHTDTYPWKDINGDLSNKQSSVLNNALMKMSQRSAAAAALSSVGCQVDKSGEGGLIVQVEEGSPADKAGLKAEDVIVAINDKKVELHTDAISEITANAPDSTVKIEYINSKSERITTTVRLEESKSDEGNGYLGVVLTTQNLELDFPIDISFDAGNVSGPSAGLAFTLAAIDQLSDGDLVGNKTIAATGEIDIEGNISPVGGVEQKAVAARKAGSKLMLVPQGEAKDAKKGAGKMKVVEVSNIQEALDVLNQNGGDKVRQMHECA